MTASSDLHTHHPRCMHLALPDDDVLYSLTETNSVSTPTSVIAETSIYNRGFTNHLYRDGET